VRHNNWTGPHRAGTAQVRVLPSGRRRSRYEFNPRVGYSTSRALAEGERGAGSPSSA
jgi:hypothetical protein